MDNYRNLRLFFEDKVPERVLDAFGFLPKPNTVLYGIGVNCFGTMDDFIHYCSQLSLSNEYIEACSYRISYFKRYAGYENVFLKTYNKDYLKPFVNKFSTMFTINSESDYKIFDFCNGFYFVNSSDVLNAYNFALNKKDKVYKLNRR